MPRGYYLFFRYLLSITCLLGLLKIGNAQQPVKLVDSLKEHMFTFQELAVLEDANEGLNFTDVKENGRAHSRFKPNVLSTPQNIHLNRFYWYRIKIDHRATANKLFVLEFFDQTIDVLDAYIPRGDGSYEQINLGDHQDYALRPFSHKNFVIPLPENLHGEQSYYFRIKSSQLADVIIVLRSIQFFVGYGLGEYFSFGIFYGMILIFCFYNLIMFFAVRAPAYLYHVGFMLSVGLFEMATDGIAYQYLWPRWPVWNQYAFGVFLCLMSVFALLFTQRLLLLRRRAPRLHTFINGIILLRVLYFGYCLWIDKSLFNYKFLEAVPLTVAFGTGVYSFVKGYRPARYFVIGYGFLFLGYLLKFLIMLGYTWLNFGVLAYYSMSFCYILEMTFLSLAVGDRVRVINIRRKKAQEEAIKQLHINQELKDDLNRNLEAKVAQRTQELATQAAIIEEQNKELSQANATLQEQRDEIARMNQLLNKDNQLLKQDVEQVTLARAMSAGLDFDEFSKAYPDQESCLKFLAELKWKDGYQCKKCAHTHYYAGHIPYSRRCAHCGYEESATAHTILQNVRIPINKSFYLIYLLYSTKGKISSHKLSETLGIRQSTCWAYSKKIKEQIAEKKLSFKESNDKGWSELLF